MATPTPQRTTRECTLDTMQPELATAVHAYIEKYRFDGIAASVLICCETTTTKQKKRLFGTKTEIVISGVILTPKRLIWVSKNEDEHPTVFSAALQNLLVEDYKTSKMYKIQPDTGLNVFGFQTANGLSSIFIGLGSQPIAQTFKSMLQSAIARG